MNSKNRFICSFVLIGLTSALLASCGAPIKNVDLQKAQASFAAAKMDPVVVQNAPLELQTAETSLQTAESLWKADAKPAEVNHHAYLALQRTAIAREIASQKLAEEHIEEVNRDRARVLLEARTFEAADATKTAKVLRLQVLEASKDADLARRQAQEQATLLAAKTAEIQQAAEEARVAATLTKQLEAEVAQLQAIKSERGLVITLGDVLFDSGKAELKGGAVATISKIANFMKTYPTRTLLVEGFTDSSGSDSFNLALSEWRANAVGSALTASAVEAQRVAVRGYGEAYPVASNETPVGRQLNRRVEVIISDENGLLTERR